MNDHYRKTIFRCPHREECPIRFRHGERYCGKDCDRLKEKRKGYGQVH